MAKNPHWTQDELLITLHFYMAHEPAIPGKTSPEIRELSELLNRLQFVRGRPVTEKFRNVNSVYMKLMNFRSLDPKYQGRGLKNRSQNDIVVWELYSSNRDELQKICIGIRAVVSSEETLPPIDVTLDGEEEAQEGQILTIVHRCRERDTKLVALKKRRAFAEHNALICEACGFNFETVYRGSWSWIHGMPPYQASLGARAGRENEDI